jgi:hypothetical protein
MKQNFDAMMIGGIGQVSGATVAELLAIPDCQQMVMVSRKQSGAIAGAQRRS